MKTKDALVMRLVMVFALVLPMSGGIKAEAGESAKAAWKNSVMVYEVPSGSMSNTIRAGDYVLVRRTSYQFASPKRGDVVLFLSPDDSTEQTLYIKRIIGEPGDTVEVRDKQVFINGTPWEESYLREEMHGEYGPYAVPEGCYFMMGDNRNFSLDSRFWENKFVAEDKILGKVIMRYRKGVKQISR